MHLDLVALGGALGAVHEVAIEVDDDHLLRPGDVQSVGLVASALHDEEAGLVGHAQAGVSEGGQDMSGQAHLRKDAGGDGDFAFDLVYLA